MPAVVPKNLLRPAAILAALWLVLGIDHLGPRWLPDAWSLALSTALLLAALALAGLHWRRGGSSRSLSCSLLFLVAWLWLEVAANTWHWTGARGSISQLGLGGTFLIGLVWLMWGVERAARRYATPSASLALIDPTASPNVADMAQQAGKRWSPLDPNAWYYGRHRQKLNQSITVLTAYSLLFFTATLGASLLAGGRKEAYELPGGGGGGGGGGAQQAVVQSVQVKKVVKKKFVINPYSSIKFEDRSVDDVKLQLVQATDHLYKVGSGLGGAGSGRGKGFGYGDGDGSGFAGGTGEGRVRFIRLEYPGGDWDQDFGVGADLNLLVEYGVRTSQKVADQTESRSIAALAAFPAEKSPPLVYLTGQRNISLSKAEIKVLREYLVDKHGMLFGDNGGSQHFHNQFFAMMHEVLPNVEPVKVPLDDVIHRVPYAIPFLPYVAPHGGKDAWGWKVDGRWLCYYHPGDIGDAWSDGHSGVSRQVTEACYELGTNVIFYAHMEYAKWLASKRKP